MAFYQKYRPQKFSDLVGQDHIKRILINASRTGKLTHAYLLTGPRGTGKTTTARLLAKAINCLNLTSGEPCNKCEICRDITAGKALDIIEIDAASHTGVDDIRDIIEKARLAPAQAKKKVYIIDEVHMLSKSAFNALLKTLEEPPAHVVFILATTEIVKVPATILSRTQRHDFKRVTLDEIVKNLKMVAAAEKIDIDDDSLTLIALAAAGGHRDALGLLEQAASGDNITAGSVEKMLGFAKSDDIFQFLRAIFNSQTEDGLKIVHQLYDNGTDMREFAGGTIEVLRRVLIVASSGIEFIEDTKENKAELVKMSKAMSADQILSILNILLEKSKLFREVSNQLLPMEMAIIELTQTSNLSVRGKQLNNDKAKVVQKKKLVPDNQMDTPQVAIGVLEMTGDIWNKIVAETKKENASLAALLKDAKPQLMTEDRLVLGVKFKFHKDRISEVKNCQVLEKVVSDIMGRKYLIKCELDEGKKNREAKPASDDELQRAVTEIFEVAE